MKKDNKIKIEKGIPIPTMQARLKYPWKNMKVGDSFVGCKTTSQAGQASKNHAPKRFIARTQPDGIIRIWRVA